MSIGVKGALKGSSWTLNPYYKQQPKKNNKKPHTSAYVL